jgi:uncharacterized protein
MPSQIWLVWILSIFCLAIQSRPTLAKPSFGCPGDSTPVEIIICNDQDISLLDGEMGAIYFGILDRLSDEDKSNFVQSQLNWLAYRTSHCGLPASGEVDFGEALRARACLVDAYRKRIAELVPSPSFKCGANDGPIEIILCSDSDLRTLDGGMGVIYRSTAKKLDEALRPAWKDDQIHWLSYRNSICNVPESGELTVEQGLAVHQCLISVYKTRIARLMSETQGSDLQIGAGTGSSVSDMPEADPAIQKISDRIVDCFNTAKGTITIQGMHDCAGVWVTRRALMLCVAQTQCPIVPDTDEGRGILTKYLSDAGLTRASSLSLDQSLFPNVVDPATLANCKSTSVSAGGLVSCVLVPSTMNKFSDVSTCLATSTDDERAKCFVSRLSGTLTETIVSCVSSGNPSPNELLSCTGNDDLISQAEEVRHCIAAASGSSQAESCVTNVLASDQVGLARCLYRAGTASTRASCFEQEFPDVSKAQKVVGCIAEDAAGDDQELQCLSTELGGDTGALATCVATKTREAAVDCVLARYPQLQAAHAAYACVSSAKDASTAALNCADALLPGLDDKTRQALSCITTASGDETALATCAAVSVLPKDAARLVGCASSSEGLTEFAVCAVAPAVNEEWRIAAECAVQSGGQPYAFAGCAATRLTVRELTKCFNGQIGTEQGCFGPNNTIVKYYTDAFKDLIEGPGPNNEVIKALESLDRVVADVGKGAEHLREEIEKHATITIDDRSLHNACKNLTFGVAGC